MKMAQIGENGKLYVLWTCFNFFPNAADVVFRRFMEVGRVAGKQVETAGVVDGLALGQGDRLADFILKFPQCPPGVRTTGRGEGSCQHKTDNCKMGQEDGSQRKESTMTDSDPFKVMETKRSRMIKTEV
jgi:hypothetical protein